MLIINGFKGGDAFSLAPADFPPVAQFGLKHALDWILGSISHANQLADDFVRNTSPRTSQDHTSLSGLQDGIEDIMKRRHHEDGEAASKTREDVSDMGLDSDFSVNRRLASSTMGSASDELPPVRSQHEYHTPQHLAEGHGPRLSGMKPPRAPHRHLPSPPGRSFPSPTSLNFPSPSGPSPASSSQGMNLPTPLSINHSIDAYLPSLTAPRASDSALREHAAALQHEVSIQKMALSSLQGEHDKLLAAFSRSQTRATTLEKKHAVSDNEIINLTEEKLRLQAQVMDLERDVEEVSRSRDEFRQSAVQESAQYIEIVNKASRLEQLRADEQRAWNQMREEMERKIEMLSTDGSEDTSGHGSTAKDTTRPENYTDEMDTESGNVLRHPSGGMKVEAAEQIMVESEVQHAPEQSSSQIIKRLQGEIQQLRERCSQAEKALRDIQADSRSMEELARTIRSRAGASAGD